MPNGGLDNCGVCGFNRANDGVWGQHDYTSDERLDNAFCTIRGVKISNALWTYCVNCHSKELTPNGPICMVGLHEEEPGYMYARIPWHESWQPRLNVPSKCWCGRFTEKGIAVETDEGEQHFCCNGHYVKWWRQQHPNESYRWDPKEWPEPEPQKPVEWLAPWYSVADNPAQVDGMERELGRELSAGHPLFGLPMRTMARRQDCDDVLFAVEDGSGRVAVVRLTWTHNPPERPPGPGVSVYPSFAAWAAEGMRRDHEDFHAELPE